MLPHFVIIGAQKAGSTLLLHCLRDHPDIYMPAGETRFFEDPEYQHSSIQQLEELFNGVSQRKLLGIKRPDYLARPQVPERIQRYLPYARLIAILRNPIERAVAGYFHLMNCGFIPIRPIEDGMPRVIRGEYRSLYPKSDEILDYGFYHQHLMRYLNYFKREQMHIVLFDALKADTAQAVKEAYGFLGVDDAYLPGVLRDAGSPMINPGLYSLTRLRWATLRNRFMYTYDPSGMRRALKRRPAPLDKIVNRLVLWIDSRLLARLLGNHKPALSAALKQQLYDVYAQDIDRLEGWLDHDLSKWKGPAQNAQHIDSQPLSIATIG
jgi:hypothetical protein